MNSAEFSHNPYFNRWFSAIKLIGVLKDNFGFVTILILIDGFLQSKEQPAIVLHGTSHNPYFNRWFSAITVFVESKCSKSSHNPYFNRWFSAMSEVIYMCKVWKGHNPYFNRWFSAIGG